MTLIEDIEVCCRAKYPLLLVQTSEEARLGRILKKIAGDINRDLLCWTYTEGLKNPAGEPVGGQGTNDPMRMLEEVKKYPSPAIIMLKDVHQYLKDPRVNRKFRDVYHVLKSLKKTIVLCSPVIEIPPEMMAEVTIIDMQLPEYDELGIILDEAVEGLQEQAESGDEKAQAVWDIISPQVEKNREALLNAGLGLTSENFENITAKCLALHNMDVNTIIGEKKQAIRKSGLLEFYPAQTTMSDVGGLENLKNWLMLREKAFSPAAKEYGLPAPKGVILVGIPGTGKSLTAKAIAAAWKMPLLRMDVGSLFGSLIGQSETRTRQALDLAETMSPCILWVDEVEKAFTFGGGDNGTSQRVFASILTWMQEKKKPVFLIATANNIAALPPELQRKGRFDEIFFLDIPTARERKDIITVQLKKHARMAAKDFDMEKLVAASSDFVGAEIEQSIIDAMYRAFSEKARKITTADIMETMSKVVPIIKSQKETIDELRKWLREGRAISASEVEIKEQGARKARTVEV